MNAKWCCGIFPAVFISLLWVCAPLNSVALIHVSLSITGNGTVLGMGSDTTLALGDTLRLSAISGTNATFAGWRGLEQFTSGNHLVWVIDRKRSIEAVFAERPRTMVFIGAAGTTFTMGGRGALAQEYETPEHRVRFNHDYYISGHEVTQGEYAELNGRLPGSDNSANDVGDSFPVYNVTWYEAVLYCNKRSRAEGYDTVYSYSGICTDPSCPFVLENLSIQYDRFGYRLPTEAEWEYACRAGSTGDYYWNSVPDSAVSHAWYYINSGGQSRKVMRLAPNRFGLYDMSGNVAEWVNDWLEYYPDSAVTDPVGPALLSQAMYEATGERPLRGGSWRLGTQFLRSACRKGPYRTSAFSSGRDIGFRVAMGAFRAASGAGVRKSPDTLPVSLACGKADLFNFLGTSNVAITFVVKQGKRRSLAFVDFREVEPVIRRCGSDTAVFEPAIAPDGRRVAYSSSGEGFPGAGSLITLCRLDSAGSGRMQQSGVIPRFWVAPSGVDTFLIFTDGASPNTQARWFSEKTWRQRLGQDAAALSAAPELLWSTGSYYGGLSSDGRFLGTSYPVSKIVDLQLGDTAIHYFYHPLNGRLEDQQVNPQVCNLAMSPSFAEPGEALLLDFGYAGESALLKKPYGQHAVIFVCNTRLMSPAHVAAWFEKPAGYDSWEFPDWSNHAGFIVSVARKENGEEAVFLIDRATSKYLKIITGSNLVYPAAWIDPAKVSEQKDPYRMFGAYDVPVQWGGQMVGAQKLRLLWRYRESVECVGVGSSPLNWGFNPARMSVRSLNVALPGSDVFTDVMIARDYVLPHAPRLKAIVFDLTPGFLDLDSRAGTPRLNGLGDSKGYELDVQKKFYRSGLPAVVVSRAAAFSARDWPGVDSNGYDREVNAGSGWGQPSVDKGDYDWNAPVVQEALAALGELADSAAARNVYLVIVSFPENPLYATQTAMVGRYGPSQETYGKLVAWVKALAERNRFVRWYDANDFGRHDYPSVEAADCNHLNSLGATRFTGRIDSIYKTLVQ